MNLPETVTIIESDLGGDYIDGHDCPLARALHRAGVRGVFVGGYGAIYPDTGKMEGLGQYRWEDGCQFNSTTIRTGTLHLSPYKTNDENYHESLAKVGNYDRRL